MGYPTKIATCCYCGTRAALVLDRARHELTCAQCGAPLHDLKMLPVQERVAQRVQLTRGPKPQGAKPKKARKVKKKKGFRLKNLVEEVFDIVEDILD